MNKIKTYRDLDYELEIVQIKRQVELDKLKGSFQKTKNSILPSLLTFALSAIFKKTKKKK